MHHWMLKRGISYPTQHRQSSGDWHTFCCVDVCFSCVSRGESESGAGLPGWNSGTCSYSGTQGWPTHQWPWCKEKLHHSPAHQTQTSRHHTDTRTLTHLSLVTKVQEADMGLAFYGLWRCGAVMLMLINKIFISTARQLTITMGIEYKVDFRYLLSQTLFLQPHKIIIRAMFRLSHPINIHRSHKKA